LQNRPDEVKGHSLKPVMDRILSKAPPMVSENVCAAPLTIRLPRKPDLHTITPVLSMRSGDVVVWEQMLCNCEK
jgi:hypothetical protein